jgi:hypothetical protein
VLHVGHLNSQKCPWVKCNTKKKKKKEEKRKETKKQKEKKLGVVEPPSNGQMGVAKTTFK